MSKGRGRNSLLGTGGQRGEPRRGKKSRQELRGAAGAEARPGQGDGLTEKERVLLKLRAKSERARAEQAEGADEGAE